MKGYQISDFQISTYHSAIWTRGTHLADPICIWTFNLNRMRWEFCIQIEGPLEMSRDELGIDFEFGERSELDQ